MWYFLIHTVWFKLHMYMYTFKYINVARHLSYFCDKCVSVVLLLSKKGYAGTLNWCRQYFVVISYHYCCNVCYTILTNLLRSQMSRFVWCGQIYLLCEPARCIKNTDFGICIHWVPILCYLYHIYILT